jgi:hypothetical protein
MNIRPGIVIVTAVGALVMGCDKPDKPDDAGRGDKVPIQQGLAATPDPSCTLPETSIGPQQKVTAGTYCVCDPVSHDQHGDYVGMHLPLYDKVVINTLADETTVQLGATPLKMKRSAGDKELEALVEYPHDKNSHPDKLVHKVRVKPIENQPTMCDKINKNVLRISFCVKEGSGWNCGDEPGGHLGDTHVEN